MKKTLLARYSGQGAKSYDARRESSIRYKNEDVAFQGFLEKVMPRSVIDCPLGTGRWLPFYQNVEGPIIGVDLSEDMLDEARKKARDLKLHCIKVSTGSILDYEFSKYSEISLDLLVCTRFVNWVNESMMRMAIANLSSSGAKWAIIGASVRPLDVSLVRGLLMRGRLCIDNLIRKTRNEVLQYVHDESCINSVIKDNSWEIVDRIHIFSSPTRENYFWLLQRRTK